MIQHNHTDVFLESFDSKRSIKRAIVIDSGCGDKYATQRFAALGASYINSYDPASTEDTSEIHKSGCVIKHTKTLLPIISTIIWSHHVIEHVHSPVTYLKLLGATMKGGSELWLGCPNTAESSVFSRGHLSNFNIGNLVLCLQCADFDVKNIKWLINSGQLRIRIKRGRSHLPKPFEVLLGDDEHFNINELPTTWRWNEK